MTLGSLSSLAADARRSVGLSRAAIIAAGALVAVAMAAGAAAAPAFGVVALLPLAIVPLLLGPPAIPLAALAAALFVQRLPPFGLVTTALLVLVGARGLEARWGRGRDHEAAGARAAPVALTTALACLLLWLALSLGWARYAAPAQVELFNWLLAAGVFGVVVTTVRTPAHVVVVVRGFIAGAVASVVIGLGAAALVPGSALAQRTWFGGRLQGGAEDPNLLAAGLVAAIALAIGALAASRRRSLERRWLLAALVVLVCGLGATQSRGGLIAAIATALVALALAPGHRLRAALGVAAVAALLAAALAVAPGGAARIVTPDAEGNGRADLWRVALRMVREAPASGVGLGNFPIRSGDLVQQPGALNFVELIAERPHVAHNTYLQLLAEVGPLGLLAYLAFVGLALSTARRAERRLAALGEHGPATLARAVLLGAVGLLVALAFLTDGDDKRLWILLGLGPALLGIGAGRTESDPDHVIGRSAS
jgi:O-antigen ligase